MKSRQKKTGRATSMTYGLIFGAAISMGITLLSTVIIAKLIDGEMISWEKVGYAVLATILAASFAGAWSSYQKIKHQRLMICFLTGIIYWAALVGITALFYQGDYQGILVTSGVILAGSMAAFLVTGPRNRRTSMKKYRNAHR